MKKLKRVRLIGRQTALVLTFALAFAFLMFYPEYFVSAAGNISGTVYIDYNMNGARNTSAVAPNRSVDKGVSGVTVTAYDPSGVQQGTATTGAGGGYTIAATGTGPYRIEFTSLPTGFFPSQQGTDNDSTVQFVPDGNSTGVDLGIVSITDYCQNDPVLVTTCFAGTVAGLSTDPVLVSFPYASGTTSTTSSANVTNPTTHALAVPQNVVGSVWGVAYHRRAQRVFTAAFTKRHAGFRNNNQGTASNDPTGEIFISNTTGATASLFLNLNTLFGSNIAGANPHDVTDYGMDDPAFDAVGKTGLGDIDLSEDEQTLYVVNLGDRNLYAIPLGSGTPTAPTASSQVTVYDLASLMNPGTGATGCPLDATTPAGQMNLNLRPGALKVSGGRVYVGLTCTAQSTGNASQLRAFVYELNPAGAGSATQVVNIALNYPRGCVSDNGSTCASAVWQPWISNIASLLDFIPWNQKYLPQPWLLDIEFDQNNFMMLGIADRVGHQTGNQNGGANTGQVEGVSAGDTLRLSQSGATWTLENNGSDGTNTTGGAGTGEGPGNGEFYFEEGYTITSNVHSEVTLGGLLNVPGYEQLVVSAMDPAPTISLPAGPNTFRAGGVIWLNNVTGARNRSYQLFNIDDPNTFGKAAGVGDMEAFCDLPALQIGNRVWNDADSDGVQDSGETGIPSVAIQLWADTNSDSVVDTQVGAATTDALGNYVFGGITDANMTGGNSVQSGTVYEVRVLSSNFGGGQPLNGFAPTVPTNDPSANGTTRDSNGIVISGSEVIASLTTGTSGQSDHTFDFGFKAAASAYSVGNRIWYDTDNDGIIDPAESGISGVSVSIFADSNTDGVPDTPGSPVATVTTDASGYYRFDGLSAGSYVIRVNPANFGASAVLEGYNNTTGINTADAESFGAASNAENGVDPATPAAPLASGVLSNTITLSGTAEPVSEADVPAVGGFAGQGTIDSQADMTVDLGFYVLSISGTVWNDDGNGTPANNNNGLQDGAELRLSGRTVRLFDSANNEILVGPDGILGTADDASGGVTTDTNGDYSFSGLPPGDYRIVVTPSAAASSTPTEADPDTNGDGNDNGFPDNTGNFPAQVISGILTLTPGNVGALSNNNVTNTSGSTNDPTVDFGLLLAPTAVRLDRASASFDGHTASISWSTGTESSNLGFNVYREQNGKRERLTRSPIPGTVLRSRDALVASGSSYTWTDRAPKPGSVYYIEDIDLRGSKTLHGPFVMRSRLTNRLTDIAGMVMEKTGTPIRTGVTRLGIPADPRRKGQRTDRITAERYGPALVGGVRIRVSDSGLIRVPVSRLKGLGFNTNADPDYWRLFSEGREIPIRIRPENGGQVEFFGSGRDTAATAERAYYLVTSPAAGARIPVVPGTGWDGNSVASSYTAIAERNDRTYYVSRILNGDAENWFGEFITPEKTTDVDIIANDPVFGRNAFAKLSVGIQGLSDVSHLVEVRMNGNQIGVVGFSDQQNRKAVFTIPASLIRMGANRVSLRSVGTDVDFSMVDGVKLEYARSYRPVGDRMRFTVPAGKKVLVSGFSSPDLRLIELDSGGELVREIGITAEQIGSGYGFRLSASGSDRVFFAATDSRASGRVSGLEVDKASDLRSAENSAAFVVISPSLFGAHAQRLVDKRNTEGLESRVVFAEDIFDEFGDGTATPEAIRNFIFYARQNWRKGPDYILLYGDSTYDPRNYFRLKARITVPTKLVDTRSLETASDGWFADFDDDGIEDLAIGRIPVGDLKESERALSKLLAFEAPDPGSSEFGLLVTGPTFESFSDSITSAFPGGVETRNVQKTSTSPEMRQRIIDELNNGPTMAVFSGHGSQAFWGVGSLFRASDADSLSNTRLPLVMMLTCLTGYSHDPFVDSLAESLIKSPNGAIAVFSSSGITFSTSQLPVGQDLARSVFAPDNRGRRIGDLVIVAKRASGDIDVRRTWQLIGDPTTRIR